MRELTLYQPPHSNADEEGLGHIYMPSSALVVAGRVMQAEVEVQIKDGNIRRLDYGQIKGALGMNVVGSPYVPIVRDIQQNVRAALGEDIRIILGGQVISGFLPEQFRHLYGDAINGNDDSELRRALGIDLIALPDPEKTSLIPAYDIIPDEDMKLYLEREFCLYLSQGCKYGCEFCAAKRTFKDPVTGKVTKVTEKYRDAAIIDDELRYLVTRAKRLGIYTLDIYLSNLDLFQTPEKLKEFARIVLSIKKDHPDFQFKLRGLSTASAFMDTYHHEKDVIQLMIDAGLWSIGFGVDGISPKIWKSVKKSHNTADNCIKAIDLTRREFGITPEVLMVVGHNEDTPETMEQSVVFLREMVEIYQAIPRPYVAKDMIPGNTGWLDPANQGRIETLLRHPEFFASLEYSALPCSLTQPNAAMIPHIEKAFREMCNLPGCTSHIIYPIAPEIDEARRKVHRILNRRKFDR